MTSLAEHDSLDAAIGERVHTLMWRHRFTQLDFAARIGVTQPTLSRKLRGDRPWAAGEIAAAAEALDVSVEYLFFGWAPRGSNPEPTGYRTLAVAA